MRNKENNGRALKWIYCRIRRYIPLTAAVSVVSALSALSFVALALITKRVMDIATGDTTGSLLKSGILPQKIRGYKRISFGGYSQPLHLGY